MSTEKVGTRNVVEVPKEEADEYARLDGAHYELWFSKGMPNNDEECSKLFYKARDYHHQLEKKYLPMLIQARVNRVTPTHIKSFRKGIDDALWDSDISNYGLADDFFTMNSKHSWCSYVNLLREEKIIPKKFA